MQRPVVEKKGTTPLKIEPLSPPVFSFTPQIKYTILLLLGFVLYVNTLQNNYALDDGGVITTNLYVQHGIAGIGKILTKDAFGSFLEQMGASEQLSGGR